MRFDGGLPMHSRHGFVAIAIVLAAVFPACAVTYDSTIEWRPRATDVFPRPFGATATEVVRAPVVRPAPRAVVPAGERAPIAVMALESPTRRVTESEVQFLTDALRKAAADVFDPRLYMVMTQASMDILLPPAQLTCLAGKCLVEIGKTLQAKYVIGGSLRDVGTGVGITLEAYEVKTGGLVGSENEVADDVNAVVKVVRELAPRLARRISEPAQ